MSARSRRIPPPISPSVAQARQACEACQRLKRRCSKDLPTCSLCARLGKACIYTNSSSIDKLPIRHVSSRRRQPALSASHTSQSSSTIDSVSPIRSYSTLLPKTAFPQAFFLDQDHLSPLALNALTWSCQQSQFTISAYLESDQLALADRYFARIHSWLPILSKKRILYQLDNPHQDTNTCRHLVLLCMQLCCTPLTTTRPGDSELYAVVKSQCCQAESSGSVCLELVQSLILLTVFEMSHAIYPAAYLTIGRAARLGMLMGLHDRHSPSLFKSPETWSLREEQRRAWWAVFVLERFIQLEPGGLPLATPEPRDTELLPVNDEDWNEGSIVPSEPLFATSFSSAGNVGLFARLCQAAHMLGKVMHHKNIKNQPTQDMASLLQQAAGLHAALCALQSAILESAEVANTSLPSLPLAVQAAFAVCACARYLLYAMYACNENNEVATGERSVLETELQALSLAGIQSLTLSQVPNTISESWSECPLLAHCLYLTATECAWFWREDHEPAILEALGRVIQALQQIEKHWYIATEFLSLLDQDEVLQICESILDAN